MRVNRKSVNYFYKYEYKPWQLTALKFLHTWWGWEASIRYNSGNPALIVSKDI